MSRKECDRQILSWLKDLSQDAEALGISLRRLCKTQESLASIDLNYASLAPVPAIGGPARAAFDEFKGLNRIVIFRIKNDLGIWAPEGIITDVVERPKTTTVVLKGVSNGE